LVQSLKFPNRTGSLGLSRAMSLFPPDSPGPGTLHWRKKNSLPPCARFLGCRVRPVVRRPSSRTTWCPTDNPFPDGTVRSPTLDRADLFYAFAPAPAWTSSRTFLPFFASELSRVLSPPVERVRLRMATPRELVFLWEASFPRAFPPPSGKTDQEGPEHLMSKD